MKVEFTNYNKNKILTSAIIGIHLCIGEISVELFGFEISIFWR